MSDVPNSLDELKAEIGANIARRQTHEVFGNNEVAVQGTFHSAPRAHHIEAANRWRNDQPEAAKRIGEMAASALVYFHLDTPDTAVASLLNELPTLFRELSAEQVDQFNVYMEPILTRMFAVDPPRTEKCLQALVYYGRGE